MESSFFLNFKSTFLEGLSFFFLDSPIGCGCGSSVERLSTGTDCSIDSSPIEGSASSGEDASPPSIEGSASSCSCATSSFSLAISTSGAVSAGTTSPVACATAEANCSVGT